MNISVQKYMVNTIEIYPISMVKTLMDNPSPPLLRSTNPAVQLSGEQLSNALSITNLYAEKG